MKLRTYIMALLTTFIMCAKAANEQKSVGQVAEQVSLTEDVDYIITDATPFATAGSVDIANTDHAVLIIANVRPSKVIANWLSHVFINGAQAVNGENCQVRMYNNGAIIYPYGKDYTPLTCYTEENFGGEACNTYTEGHNGGFMKSLNNTTLNNQISSFKLKRGYMVTFAIGTSGWGYSRCFVADKEDLEITSLPAILNNKISSYRIFKWLDFNKRAVANTLDKNLLYAVNAYAGYAWSQGEDLGPDFECISNHIYEDYPSPAANGSVTYTCNMKTNNEPKNSADDHPQDLPTILNNWQNLMRTGLRLGSPTSWDGSDYWNGTGFIKTFLDSIDARGWRCDFVDAHCYWPSGNFGHLENYWWTNMHRPIWISEWVWGASWNHNGAFAEGVTEAQNAETLKGILNTLKNSPHVERYFYWNSERDPSRIYKDGQVTAAGKVYADIDPGLGFNNAYQYVPKDTRIEPLTSFASSYSRTSGNVTLTWTDPNCELSEEIRVQRKKQGEFTYETVGTLESRDKTNANGINYTYTDNISEPGTYIYRVQVVTYNGKTINTSEEIVNAAPSQGTSKVQYGALNIADTEQTSTFFSVSMEETPCVFIGAITNVNSTFYPANYTSKLQDKSKFTFQLLPWLSSKDQEPKKAEEVPFLAMPEGNYKYGNMDCEVAMVQSNKATGTDNWTDVTEVTFKQPFPEGVTPVVLTELRNPSYATSSTKKTSLCVRIFDVTNTGFKFIIYSEDMSARKIVLPQRVCYLAVTPGFEVMDADNGIMIAAGHGTDNQIYGILSNANSFRLGDGEEATQLKFVSPVILAALQTNNYPACAILRRTNVTEKNENDETVVTGIKIKRALDHSITVNGEEIPTTSSLEKYSAYRDNLGWVVIANKSENGSIPSGIDDVTDNKAQGKLNVRIVNGSITVDGASNGFKVYNAAGTQVSPSSLPAGIYMVVADGKQMKVQIR